MKKVAATVFAFMLGITSMESALAADAHVHQDVKSRHGGVVVEVSDVEYELVRRDAALVIYVSDHGKPIATKGWSGSITTLSGEKASAELVAAAENVLEVRGGLQVKPGTRLLATIQPPGKKPVQVRFTSK